ncbi:MAG: BMC domain-containing protein [Ignavibacteriaceae bacterium]|nr:BMC domain-containing protein [Ignavibacteriaceae bacterium]
MSRALGLIETRGLVGAIEAADAMVKAANVTIVGKEKTVPAMITIQIAGEVAAVRSAIDAGAAAAQRVGQLISVHIIPQPDEQMEVIIPQLFSQPEKFPVQKPSTEAPQKKNSFIKNSEVIQSASEVVKQTEILGSDVISTKQELTAPLKDEITNQPEAEIATLSEMKTQVSPSEETPESDNTPGAETDTSEIHEESLFDSETEPADNLTDSAIEPQIIETAPMPVPLPESEPFDEVTEKMFEDLPDNFSLMDSDIYSLNVHQLRKLARQIDNFPIQGREISKANRNELLRHFEALRSP